VTTLLSWALALTIPAIVVGFAARILLGIRARTLRNRAFLATAIVAKELAPGLEVTASFQAAPASSHAVWLDLALAGGSGLPFEVSIAVRLGGRVLVDETFAVRFDDEGDAQGLPSGYGTTALDTTAMTGSGASGARRCCARFASTRRRRSTSAARREVRNPPGGVRGGLHGEVRARLTPGAGVTVQHARLLVTPKDAPPG